MKFKIQNATADSFKKYGQVVELNPQEAAFVSLTHVNFWKQQASYYIKGKTEIGVIKIKKSEMIFDELENHFITPTIIIPMNGDFILPVAGPSDKIPNSVEVEAFYIRKDQFIILSPKAWHGVIYPVNDNELTLLVIFEENTLNNDTVFHPLNEQCSIVNN